MNQLNVTIIPTQAAANRVTDAVPAWMLTKVSMQAIATGTLPGGVVYLQASNEPAPTNWGNVATLAVSGVGTFLSPSVEVCYQWVRINYTNTGGGNITVVIKGWTEPT